MYNIAKFKGNRMAKIPCVCFSDVTVEKYVIIISAHYCRLWRKTSILSDDKIKFSVVGRKLMVIVLLACPLNDSHRNGLRRTLSMCTISIQRRHQSSIGYILLCRSLLLSGIAGHGLWTSLYSSLKQKRCVPKTTRQKWKHLEVMFIQTLHYHQLDSSSRLQSIIYRKFCKHS